MSTGYEDISDGKPRVTSYDDNGVRTTTTTTKLGVDPNEKPKETVSGRTIQHPDSTETVTVTEKKLPPIRYTETITREKLPKKVVAPQIQITRATPTNGPVNIPTTPVIVNEYPTTTVPQTYNVVRRERVIDEPNTYYVPPPASRVIVRQNPEPTTTLIREPTPISYIQAPNLRGTRIVEIRQPQTPVIIDVATPPVTTKTTTIIDNANRDTLIDDRRTLVNYQDDYYGTRRVGRRTDWCGGFGADCCGCSCFDDCCGTTSCCRTNSFAQRRDVVSHRTRVTKDGRRVRYRNADVPGYRCCNCCTGWCSRICPCCSCLEWFCACPCWLWLCCLLPLLLALLGLSIGLLTQLPSIIANNNAIANNNNNNNVQTLRVIEQTTNETWYVYGSDQPCAGGAVPFPAAFSTITTLIPCGLTTTSWARIIQATTVVTLTNSGETFVPDHSIKSGSNTNTNQGGYNELRVTQSYNTVLAVLGQNAVCQPDRNLPGTPLYCDQTTTQFSVSATASSSTVFAIQVNESVRLDSSDIILLILLCLSIVMQKSFQFIVRSIHMH